MSCIFVFMIATIFARDSRQQYRSCTSERRPISSVGRASDYRAAMWFYRLTINRLRLKKRAFDLFHNLLNKCSSFDKRQELNNKRFTLSHFKNISDNASRARRHFHYGQPPRGGGVLLGIFGGVVPPASPNPDPISDQKLPFPIPFSDLALNVIKHSICISVERKSVKQRWICKI